LVEASETGHRARQAELSAEQIALDLRLAEISAERRALMPGIRATDLAAYDSLRRRKGGLAVAQVRSETCTVCGVAVSPNRRWHLREGDLVHCGNCERIIVLV
jgi:predicted  nucleic acid-binding Zn-ribbon protein